jgi:glucans biosynthesis protein
MFQIDRRKLVASLALSGASTLAGRAHAQQQGGPVAQPPVPVPGFGFESVLRRARELASVPLTPPPALPEPLAKLDAEAWRDIRFRPERALLSNNNSLFRLQTYHLGHLYRRPVTVNVIRDGIATPIPYAANLFDYGATKFEKPLPVNLGFAGFRLNYALNDPRSLEEVISFLGASNFRFLGRGQRFGVSSRGLAVNGSAASDEAPFFREFWIETPEPGADRITIYALLDGETAAGAYRFDLTPGRTSMLEVNLTLFPRKAGAKIGVAPLASMFFMGEGDRRAAGDYRPEVHDSDGLLIQTGAGEWLWRPLRNPAAQEVSTFADKDMRGFGLMQRDRAFEHYQDLELGFEQRPSYWVEPIGAWGEGHVELVETPAADESSENIAAFWVPREAPEPGKPFTLGYRIRSTLDMARLSPAGRAISSFQAQAKATGPKEPPPPPNARRFLIDFAGGDLPFFLSEPSAVETAASASSGRILRSFIAPNPHIKGFRAGFDVQLDPGQSADLRVFLRAGGRALTEVWTMPLKAE